MGGLKMRSWCMPQDASAEERTVLNTIEGIYFKKPGMFHKRDIFQQAGPVVGNKLLCSPLHLFWSVARGGWKIGVLDDTNAGMALNCQDTASPSELTAKWSLLLSAQV